MCLPEDEHNNVTLRMIETVGSPDPGPLLRRQEGRAEALIPLDFLESISLVGPEGYIKERLAAFDEAGVTHLNGIPVPNGDQTQTGLVSMLKEWTA